MSNESFTDYWLEKENVLSSIYSKAMEEIENNLLPLGIFPESMEEEEDPGKLYSDIY